MRAAICREFGAPLSIEDVSLGAPGAGEMRIKVAACAICHSDISFINGYWGGRLPFLVGHEIAGIVTEVGDGVTGFDKGTRLVATLIKSCGKCGNCKHGLESLCLTPPDATGGGVTGKNGEKIKVQMDTGGFAEEVVVHQRQCIPIPDTLPYHHASLLGCGVITGYGSVNRVGKVRAGDSVGVIGVGGVGINAIIASRIIGADPILAIDTASAKKDFFMDMGATCYINPAEGAEATLAAVKSETGGRGLDIALVGVGSSRVVESALPMIRRGGRVVVMGIPASGDIANIDLSMLASDGKSLLGTKMGSTLIHEDIPELIELCQEGKIDLERLLSHRYPFAEINDAINKAMEPDTSRVVLEFDI